MRLSWLPASLGLLDHFTRVVPDMYPKAYRWVAEMQEVAAFAGSDAATRDIYDAIAALYAALAQDVAGSRERVGALDAFLASATNRTGSKD